jgi:REP element-mobilizing transposase RayT
MPRNRKFIPPKQVVFVTFRTEEGLPLAANPFMEALIWSVLARAHYLYKVKVLHFLVMGNHFHFLLYVEDPEAIPAFVCRVKTELAHAINRLLGRRKRTIWAEGYDCAVLLTLEDVIAKIVYIYTNPQEEFLVGSVEKYPNVSSFPLWRSGKYTVKAKWIHRDSIEEIPKGVLTYSQQRAIADSLMNSANESHDFELFPDYWMSCFQSDQQPEELNRIILNAIREKEREIDARRLAEKKTLVGAEKLRLMPIASAHSPKKFGRRLWSRDKQLRKSYISFVKRLVNEAKSVVKRWKTGDFSARFPLGLFPPRLPIMGNLLPPYQEYAFFGPS